MSHRPSTQAPHGQVLTHEGAGTEIRPASEAASPPGPAPSLLDAILESTSPLKARALPSLEPFLKEPSTARALARWLGSETADLVQEGKQRITQRLSRDIARINELLNRQVNAILHHPQFQRLEASWRGLHYLTQQVPEGENIKVRVLSLPWKELGRDMRRALEFDQSQLFRKIYGDEFDMPGGEPFGVLVGDYEFTNHPEDLDLLGKMSGLAAASFAPFISAAHPALLDLERFTDLEKPLNLPQTFEQLPYVGWRRLRESEDSRFVGLTLPRVLMRLPYQDIPARVDGFRFHEEVGRPDRSAYLWGNAAYPFAGLLMRTFAATGWLADIRGVQRGVEAGGLVTGLPAHSFATDRRDLVPRSPTEVIITDALDKELGEQGLLPLCWCQDTGLSVFYGSQSIQKPKAYDESSATVNARLSATLQYMFCAARFAHYIKVMARDRVGGYSEAADYEDYLNRWLLNYTNANPTASLELKARHPLREGRVQVKEVPGRPGRYACAVYLRPQFQLEQLVGSIRLETKLTPGSQT